MTKEIEVNGVVHEFPDEATPEQINLALGGKPLKPSSVQQMEGLQQEHPHLMKLAEMLQSHPSLNKAISTAAPYAEHFNRATQGTGLPNMAKGAFVGMDKLARMAMNAVPTGAGLPDVNIPDPGWSQKEIPSVNPRIQKGAEIVGEAIPYGAALMEALPALRMGGEALADLPIRPGAGGRALNRSQEMMEGGGNPRLRIPEEHFRDIEENQFLRNTAANRRMLERARHGNYRDLFSLQSDLGQRERSFTRDPFSAANRQFGRDIGQTRHGVIDEMRRLMREGGHDEAARLMQHGQNRYRQYMALRPYLAALAGGTVAYAVPYAKELKKFLP